MNKTIGDILGKDVLPPELLDSLQEAFDNKIEEARQEANDEAQTSVREELAQRYEHDKEQLVEAMDRMITDVVNKYETQKIEEFKKLREAQQNLKKTIKEGKAKFKTTTKEHLTHAGTFVAEKLAEEVKTLRAEKKSLAEDRVKIAKQVASLKENLSRAHNSHVKKIDEFVVKQVVRELKEFDQDRRSLVETRVKLAAESRTRLKETQRRFVKESAKKLDTLVTEQLTKEMTQLHEDLERNRQNNFGRKIFEAVAAEYMTSYFSEGSEARKVQEMLEGMKSELVDTKQKLVETSRANEVAKRNAKLSEDRAERSKVIAELLSNIRGEKRAIMEGMLEGCKTTELRRTFDRLLPVVLNEARKPAKQGNVLTEDNNSRDKSQIRVVTGDQRNNRLIETIEAESNLDSEAVQILRLAGVQKS